MMNKETFKANFFAEIAKMDSDEAWLDELREGDTPYLEKMRIMGERCLEAMVREPERYWEWRLEQPGLIDVRCRKPLDVVERVTRRQLRLINVVLEERKKQ